MDNTDIINLHIQSKTLIQPDNSVRTLLENASISLLNSDHSLAILGRSGSGKTTLLKILAGLDTDFLGEYYYKGKLLTLEEKSMSLFRHNTIGYITQEPLLLPGRTIIDNVLLALPRNPELVERAFSLLDYVAIDFADTKKINNLSGGEAQRVSMVRALVRQPSIILADEPTGALDEDSEKQILNLFEKLQSEGIRFIIATHNSEVSARCSRIFKIANQTITSQ